MNMSEEIENDFNKAKKIEDEVITYLNKIRDNPLTLTNSVILFNLGRSKTEVPN